MPGGGTNVNTSVTSFSLAFPRFSRDLAPIFIVKGTFGSVEGVGEAYVNQKLLNRLSLECLLMLAT